MAQALLKRSQESRESVTIGAEQDQTREMFHDIQQKLSELSTIEKF